MREVTKNVISDLSVRYCCSKYRFALIGELNTAILSYLVYGFHVSTCVSSPNKLADTS